MIESGPGFLQRRVWGPVDFPPATVWGSWQPASIPAPAI